MIGRSLVQIPALGSAELHVEVSLSEILNPTLLTSECPAMSWRLTLRQAWDWLQQQHPATPWKGISCYYDNLPSIVKVPRVQPKQL